MALAELPGLPPLLWSISLTSFGSLEINVAWLDRRLKELAKQVKLQ